MYLREEEDEKMLATHEGWYWFCPIWIAFTSDGTPMIAPKVFDWIFWVANEWQQLLNVLIAFVDEDACGFRLKVRQLKTPKTIYL